MSKRLNASYSYRTYVNGQKKSSVNGLIEEAELLSINMWGKQEVLILDPTIRNNKLPTWTNMALVSEKDKDQEVQLCVIWWSEFEPDTSRVLDVLLSKNVEECA